MARAKKESVVLNIRLSKDISEKLTNYCDDAGQTKTLAVERALEKYIEDYYAQKKLLEESNIKDTANFVQS